MNRPFTCPICERMLPSEVNGDALVFPFCSPRCKQVDLHRWLNGDYAFIADLDTEELMAELPEDDGTNRLPHDPWHR